ncbi:MAG: DUF2867 domain-containing protein [Bacteroidota bacterium]
MSIITYGSLVPDPYTYTDSYRAKAESDHLLPIEVYARAFFLAAPSWVLLLMRIRNRLVGWFGLKTSQIPENREHILLTSSFEMGEEFGLFKVCDKSEHGIVLGQDDKHLDFRIVIEQKREGDSVFVELTTHVRFKNTMGRLYFGLIKPFHNIISRQLVKRMSNPGLTTA